MQRQVADIAYLECARSAKLALDSKIPLFYVRLPDIRIHLPELAGEKIGGGRGGRV
jgi:hypothetical protein